jgi:hypothetical protein
VLISTTAADEVTTTSLVLFSHSIYTTVSLFVFLWYIFLHEIQTCMCMSVCVYVRVRLLKVELIGETGIQSQAWHTSMPWELSIEI